MTEVLNIPAASERRAGIHSIDFHDYGYRGYFCLFFKEYIQISKEQDNLDDSFILNVCNGKCYCS